MSFDVTTLALAKSYADQHGGGGASTTGDFIIKMTLASDDNGNFTVTSCDTTVEQIDAAVAAEKRVVVIASYSGIFYELPMIWGAESYTYHFGTVQDGRMVTSLVITYGSTSEWDFSVTQTDAIYVDYSNAAMPNVTSVGDALDELVTKSHTHANKSVLDKFAETGGKLQYNGSDVGLKGDKGDTPVKGTDYWTAADKAEIVADTLAALPTWTGGSY